MASKIFGDFQFTSIVNISTGAPVSIRDPRGTLNRNARSAIQPASSTLTTNEIKEIVGIFRTPNGVFYVDPRVLQATVSGTCGGVTTFDLTQVLPAGCSITAIRGTAPVGSAPFAGQVFFRNEPGSVGNLPINFINGPMYVNWNAGLFRNIRFGETKNLQLRFEVFNVINRANFFLPSGGNAVNNGENSDVFNVNSTSFGRLTGTFDPRIVQFGARFDF